MMKSFVAVIFVLLTAGLFASGLSILVSEGAPAPEKHAAAELRKYLSLIAGEEFPEALPAIHVGRSEEALGIFGLGGWEELLPDEVLYCVAEDGSLWLAGQGTRGTLYAVYEFLEREYGVRFYTNHDELVPLRKPFALPKPGTFVRYAPPIAQRANHSCGMLWRAVEFRVKCRINGYCMSVPEEWGGAEGVLGNVHTFAPFLGKKYFADHPEWYSMNDGERSISGSDGYQLCLSNQELRKEFSRLVLERLRADGGKHRFISVSQNDNKHPCECTECNAFIASHGNQSDLLIDFVNAIADAVAPEFPDVGVETIAYNYTRQPPKSIRPRKNVAVRYCTIEANIFFPLDSAPNDFLFQEIAGWREIADKMCFWNYTTDFFKYYLPHPNWKSIGPDIRLFRESKAVDVFEQSCSGAVWRFADLGELRNYLICRMLWNPDQDDAALIRDFCEHHYGEEGARLVLDYIQATTAAVQRHPELAGRCYSDDTRDWLSGEELAKIWSDLWHGAKKHAADPVYGLRLAEAALPITMNLLERPELLRCAPSECLPLLRDNDPLALIDWCRETMVKSISDDSPNLTREKILTVPLAENPTRRISWWLDLMTALYSPRKALPSVPTAGIAPEGISAGRKSWCWNVEDLSLPWEYLYKFRRYPGDPAAIGWMAMNFILTHEEPLLQIFDLPKGTFDVWVTVRCDPAYGKTPTGDVLTIGTTQGGELLRITAQQCAGSQYKTFSLGRLDLTNVGAITGAPCLNSTVSKVWIDRIIFVE